MDRQAHAQLLSAITIPDKIEANWGPFEKRVKAEVNRRMEINNDKLKQTFAKYKSTMEKAIIHYKVGQQAWN